MDDRHFEKALDLVLYHEGGYVNDPDDPGGETNFGISKRAYPYLNIKGLTKADAARIYKADYWDRGRYGMIDNREIACRAFDLGVNCGVSNSVKFLQQAWNLMNPSLLRGLAEDGIMGLKTANAINTYKHPKALLSALKRKAQDHYLSCKNKNKYLGGWFNRLED